jgi:hypothetical protein
MPPSASLEIDKQINLNTEKLRGFANKVAQTS